MSIFDYKDRNRRTSTINRLIHTMLEAARYFMVAVLGLSIDWTCWEALWIISGHPIIAQAVSRALGGIVVFLLLRAFAFSSGRKRDARQARRYAFAWFASWVTSLCLVKLCTLVFLPPPVAKAVSDATTFCINYFVMKFWVFASTYTSVSATTRATSTID